MRLLIVACLAIVVCAAIAIKQPRAQEPTSEYVKQVLRLQYTEFCSVVGKPPLALADAINGAIAQDPATWLPIAGWWNRIKEHYEKAKCNDA